MLTGVTRPLHAPHALFTPPHRVTDCPNSMQHNVVS